MSDAHHPRAFTPEFPTISAKEVSTNQLRSVTCRSLGLGMSTETELR